MKEFIIVLCGHPDTATETTDTSHNVHVTNAMTCQRYRAQRFRINSPVAQTNVTNAASSHNHPFEDTTHQPK